MTSLQAHQRVQPTAGDAIGRLEGINHLQLIVRDMDESVRFYRDVLGLKVIRTCLKKYLNEINPTPVTKNYFFRLGNGEMITLIEVKNAPKPEPSIWDLWPADSVGVPTIRKMDHLAFNVPTYAELEWFQQHLSAKGVAVTEILGREHFVKSIYFTDPTGNPLEIATFAWEDVAAWEGHEPEDWFADDEPVPSLLEG